MTNRLSEVSGARLLAGTSGFFGIILIAIPMILGVTSPILVLFALPFITVLTVSAVDLPPFTRAVFYWICAAAAVFPAAMLVFSGIGLFLAAIIVAWLFAAWHEMKAES